MVIAVPSSVGVRTLHGKQRGVPLRSEPTVPEETPNRAPRSEHSHDSSQRLLHQVRDSDLGEHCHHECGAHPGLQTWINCTTCPNWDVLNLWESNHQS